MLNKVLYVGWSTLSVVPCKDFQVEVERPSTSKTFTEMSTQPLSTQYRLKAEAAEEMAKTVSYRPDRERFLADARKWRRMQSDALADEAQTRGNLTDRVGEIANRASRHGDVFRATECAVRFRP
jgi:hypothetical protein